jgi:hypothetical protein
MLRCGVVVCLVPHRQFTEMPKPADKEIVDVAGIWAKSAGHKIVQQAELAPEKWSAA